MKADDSRQPPFLWFTEHHDAVRVCALGHVTNPPTIRRLRELLVIDKDENRIKARNNASRKNVLL